jgi:predicted trehalose synthase
MINTLRGQLQELGAAAAKLDQVLAGVEELPAEATVEAAQHLVALVKLADGLRKTGGKLKKLAERLANPLFDGPQPSGENGGTPARPARRKAGRG